VFAKTVIAAKPVILAKAVFFTAAMLFAKAMLLAPAMLCAKAMRLGAAGPVLGPRMVPAKTASRCPGCGSAMGGPAERARRACRPAARGSACCAKAAWRRAAACRPARRAKAARGCRTTGGAAGCTEPVRRRAAGRGSAARPPGRSGRMRRSCRMGCGRLLGVVTQDRGRDDRETSAQYCNPWIKRHRNSP
jgi:hypothetical protein